MIIAVMAINKTALPAASHSCNGIAVETAISWRVGLLSISTT
jgi:hypothetical protein